MSGEYVLARPPKKPGGMTSCVNFLVLLGMGFKGAEGFNKEDHESTVTLSDVVSVVLVIAFVIAKSRGSSQPRSRGKRRSCSKKNAEVGESSLPLSSS